MMDHSAVKLPFYFEPAGLQADLEKMPADAWQRHYNSKEYEGDWAVLPLRSVAGHPDVIYAVPNGGMPDFYQNTPFLNDCPAFQAVLSVFQCTVGAARLMRLGAGARILEHADEMGEGQQQEIRLHIPIQTNAGVFFWVDGKLVPMLPGELWYADFGKPHRVDNHGETDRVHLVVDCLVNEWLNDLLNKARELTAILHFLDEIGIPYFQDRVESGAFLPGIAVQHGQLFFDPTQLLYPGDLLHEAGHIAVAEQRDHLQTDVTKDNPNAMGYEIAAILWSYAALKHIGLPPETVFHPHGYRGSSQWFIDQFTAGQYMGLPLLEWMGLTAGPEKAQTLGVLPFPHMVRWLR